MEPASSICAELEVNQCVVQQWLSRHHVPSWGTLAARVCFSWAWAQMSGRRRVLGGEWPGLCVFGRVSQLAVCSGSPEALGSPAGPSRCFQLGP